jgi:hypothetical protein
MGQILHRPAAELAETVQGGRPTEHFPAVAGMCFLSVSRLDNEPYSQCPL